MNQTLVHKLNVYMAEITGDLAKKSGGWSPGGPHVKSTPIHFHSNLSNNHCQMDKKNEEA